jgi:hypothetical protein
MHQNPIRPLLGWLEVGEWWDGWDSNPGPKP